MQLTNVISKTRQPHILSYHTFDLGLTPTPQPLPLYYSHRPTKQPPILSYLIFDLGITPPGNGVTSTGSYQDTESSQVSSTQVSANRAIKFKNVYKP